ncbi:hypothetical protein TRSC58_05603 [Trypanosoma rangeli SC58]|uniref:Leishmanolysin-like peptidase n=1 Tax=Trypanosoma rangeli SC58 TaxID=429131 RepID=A0A061IXA6_TRYRA|nr:hypothetical protein TRSC58_05603 [Trypanosoma rangeli SC58]
MNKCPYVVADEASGCTNSELKRVFGSFVGPNSRCVKGRDLSFTKIPIGDVCVNTQCDKGALKVQFYGDTNWYNCDEGETVEPLRKEWSGSIVCPRYADVCTVFPDISLYPIPVVDPPLIDNATFTEDAEPVKSGNADTEITRTRFDGKILMHNTSATHNTNEHVKLGGIYYPDPGASTSMNSSGNTLVLTKPAAFHQNLSRNSSMENMTIGGVAGAVWERWRCSCDCWLQSCGFCCDHCRRGDDYLFKQLLLVVGCGGGNLRHATIEIPVLRML